MNRTCTEELGNTIKYMADKPEGKGSLWIHEHRLKDTIKTNLKERGYENVNLINLAENKQL
jgi:hypothetical protein